MAYLDDNAQWIILLGFLVSVIILGLAIISNEAGVVGKTTAESALEFPKNDISDIREEIIRATRFTTSDTDLATAYGSIKDIVRDYKFAIINVVISDSQPEYRNITIDYNNGVTKYHEELFWIKKA